MRAWFVIGIVWVVMHFAESRAEPRPIPAYSVWQGSYTCAQGITSVRLTIETRSTGGAVMGRFEFGPHRNNPKVPTGLYWMKGTVRVNARGALELELSPDRWANQPTGYVMVGLHATSDPEQHTLEGTIDHRGCGTISVKRIEAERN